MSGVLPIDPEDLLRHVGARRVKPPPNRGTVHTVATAERFSFLVDDTSSPLQRGDTIAFAAGTYDLGTVYVRGRAAGCLVKPEDGAGVEFTGRTAIHVFAPDMDWHGFRASVTTPTLMKFGSDSRTVGHNSVIRGWNCNDSRAGILFDVRADDVEICDCTFANVDARVLAIVCITPPGTVPTPQRCHFHNNTVGPTKPGSRKKWMGCGGGVWHDWNPPYDGFSTKALIECNLIQGWLGNAEWFGLKSSDNLCRLNYFQDSGEAGGRINVLQ